MKKKIFVMILALCVAHQSNARSNGAWDDENISPENRALFFHLNIYGTQKINERDTIAIEITKLEHKIAEVGTFSEEQANELVTLLNKCEHLNKDIEQNNLQIRRLYDLEKRILELRQQEEDIKRDILEALVYERKELLALEGKDPSDCKNSKISLTQLSSRIHIHKLEDRLVDVVNEKINKEKQLMQKIN